MLAACVRVLYLESPIMNLTSEVSSNFSCLHRTRMFSQWIYHDYIYVLGLEIVLYLLQACFHTEISAYACACACRC